MLDKFYRSIILCILIFFAFANNSYATHAMGADLTYSCIGNNQYRIRLQFYRDCNGINAASTETVNISSSGCGNIALNLPLLSVTEVTPSCPGLVGTACNNGGGQFGIQRFVYESTVTLPATCTNWSMSWQLCCRNNAITTLTNPGSNEMYIKATLNTGLSSCNNSPVFLNDPTPFACVNQPVFYNHGASDSDGDNLRFSLTNCYSTASTVVSYSTANGISSTRPLITSASGIVIDPNSGAISFTPTAVQIGVLCVLVEEFRNGVKIGEVVRDIQFSVVNCINQIPVLSGINGTNDFDTVIQAGQQLCFDIFSSDPDSGQILSLNYNQAIPNGSFSYSGSPFPTATFCWTPTNADSGFHSFTVQVSDNYCPIVGQNTYTYTIYVLPEPQNPAPCILNITLNNISNLRCSSNDGSVVVVAVGGVAPYTFTLINQSNGQIYTNTSGVFNNLTAGNYNVVVSDQNGCQPNCTNTTFTISGSSLTLSHTASVNSVPCPAPNSFGGVITLNASGGTPPYLYSIGNGFVSSNVFNSVASGTYQTVVMDANACYSTQVVTLNTRLGLSATASNIIQPTCGRINGRFSVIATGGTAPYQYQINNTVITTNTFTNLSGGTYNVIVRDAANCVFTFSVTLNGNASFVLSTTSTSATCRSACNGTATVTSNVSATYVWNNGQTGSTISNLCRGTYTVTATDVFGCIRTARVVVREPAQLRGSLLSVTNESCIGRDAVITLSANGGTAPYQYSLTNLADNTSQTNTSGVFNGLSAGTYLYTVNDINGCSSGAGTRIRVRKDCRNTGPLLSLRENSVSVIPNPAVSTTQIVYFTESENSVTISVLDLNGKLLYEKTEQNSQGQIELNVSTWSPATYLVIMRAENGDILETTKLIIIK